MYWNKWVSNKINYPNLSPLDLGLKRVCPLQCLFVLSVSLLELFGIAGF